MVEFFVGLVVMLFVLACLVLALVVLTSIVGGAVSVFTFIRDAILR